MSFLASTFNLLLKKIANRNLPFELEVGECWNGLQLSADCRFMQLRLGRQGYQFRQCQLFDLSGYFFANNIKQT
ncbi:hypothetical protein BZZ01_05285 [Nostocales cyanobacterium HT-58-2]|nr:hypothetical protein BZZ01_05285 [Nostocales cyanobacterium HT-58-2]